MTLRVAEASGAAPAAAGAGDKAELRRAFERRAQAARRAEKWADRAMEEVLERDVFLKAVSRPPPPPPHLHRFAVPSQRIFQPSYGVPRTS
jgi:hypothetical protein